MSKKKSSQYRRKGVTTDPGVAEALLQAPGVEECTVLVRHRAGASEGEKVAYLALSGPFQPEQLRSYLPAEVERCGFVPLSSLPRNSAGEVDTEALSQLPVLDEDVARRLEEKLQEVPGIAAVAVVEGERQRQPLPFHLADLLPAEEVRRRGPEPPAGGGERRADGSSSTVPAVSIGEPLSAELPGSLAEVLERAAERCGSVEVTFLQHDGSEITLTYRQLLEDARRIQAGLWQQGLKPGDLAIFQLDRNEDFAAAFWGSVLAGVVPVSIAVPPSYDENSMAVQKVENNWRTLGHPVLLTCERLVPELEALGERLEMADLRLLILDELRHGEAAEERHHPGGDDLALLLQTSGSTGMPKAVMQTHQRLLSQIVGAVIDNDLSSRDVSFNWMPIDHVATLVMFHVRDTYLGIRQIHAPTRMVLADILLWLDLLDRYRATVTWTANFAFGLVNARHEELSQRAWDLSPVRCIINAGEPIVASTARRFLALLRPFGLSDSAVVPCWGMSETSSGVTHFHLFTPAATSDEDPFVDVGGPIPGFDMRIVDDGDRVVTEETVGHLQVRGAPVTPGYYLNEEANRESYTADGWFRTGDLGFLRQGRLIITGRAKEVIIIAGINHYAHEIEKVVEAVEGVAISFVAVFGVREAGSDTDSLVVVFSPEVADEKAALDAIPRIRERVVRDVGLNPSYVIPVTRKEIPKTVIGKIQRGRLRQRFEEGGFDQIIRRFDVLLGNEHTLPNWFYRPVWRPRAAAAGELAAGGTMVFLDAPGLGESLCAALEKEDRPVVRVTAGDGFERLAPRHYRIAPGAADHYRRLWDELAADDAAPARVVHLWTYSGAGDGGEFQPERLEEAQERGSLSLLALLHALAPRTQPTTLLVVSSGVQKVASDDPVDCVKRPLLGVVKAAGHEIPTLDCRHLDLPGLASAQELAQLRRELAATGGEREVAYRGARRLVPRLAAGLSAEMATEPFFEPGGLYVITGGLGGVGTHLARFLLQRFELRLLLLGRTPVDGDEERQKVLRRLSQLPGEVVYQAVDVAEGEALERALTAAEERWGRSFDGAFHLAGAYHHGLLANESRDSWWSVLRPKVLGAANLHRLLARRPGARLVTFSSVTAIFGGAAIGAYAAANAFLQGLPDSFCYDWSTWDDTGMSRGFEGLELTRARGYRPLSPEQGLYSLVAALDRGCRRLAVGLEEANPHLRRFIATADPALRELTACYVPAETAPEPPPATAVADRFGTAVDCQLRALAELPRGADGEIDRRRLAAIVAGETQRPAIAAPRDEIERRLAEIWSRELRAPRPDLDRNFFELGASSLLMARINRRIAEEFGQELSMVELFRYSTLRRLAERLRQQGEEERPAAPAPVAQGAAADSEIAIIGLACRVPGAASAAQFWRNLRGGVESISFFSRQELLDSGVEPALAQRPEYVPASGVLADVESFDAEFFSMSRMEAELTDPQHRIFLECVWEALEDAGYTPRSYDGAIGIYGGAGMHLYPMSSYLLRHVYPQRRRLESTLAYQALIANDPNFLPTQVAYKLDLKGPAVNVQTACSTSLVALHLACRSLRHGECRLALVGAASVHLPQKKGYLAQEGMILSPDGHCRAFDADARGTVGGSGAGVVVLKRLAEARADEDHVYAVIRGSAINNDGALKVSYMAPSVDGQAAVIAAAQAAAGVEPESISYVETHGTGTALGDPIEVAGLTQAFRGRGAEDRGFCALGSVKTNIGHLDTAAGMAGLIKTALALDRREIPPSLNYQRPNPKIDFESSPFFVNTELRPWPPADGQPRRAGVSSFGVGGTNAHVVLEEAPEPPPRADGRERPVHLLTLSARSEEALGELAGRWAEVLAAQPLLPAADVAFTANAGRSHFAHRLAVRGAGCSDWAQNLEKLAAGGAAPAVTTGHAGDDQPRVAFLFPGQGSQAVGMGRQLYDTQPTFRRVLERCDEILRPHLDRSLLSLLYPQGDGEEEAALLAETLYTQPVLFVLEMALAELWRSWGVEPAIVVGHSVGEYAAACVAGAFDLEDALLLVARRARQMQEKTRPGMMVAVFAGLEQALELTARWRDQLAVAAVNGSTNVVLSGATEAVTEATEALRSADLEARILKVSQAFHSPLMDPVLDELEALAAEIDHRPFDIPLIANLDAEVLGAGHRREPRYWARHARQTVAWQASIERLAGEGIELWLELGPKPILKAFERSPRAGVTWLPSLTGREDDWQPLLRSLAALYVRGVDVSWSGFDRDYPRRRLSLPTYPFQRQRCWIEEETPMTAAETPPAAAESVEEIRRRKVLETLRTLMQDLLQTDSFEDILEVPFIELGADSIVLIHVIQSVESTFGVKMSFRQFFEELTSIEALISFLVQQLPAGSQWDAAEPAAAEPAAAAPAVEATAAAAPPAPAEATAAPAAPAAPTTSPAPVAAAPAPVAAPPPVAGGVEGLLSQQLHMTSQIIAQQLEFLRGGTLAPSLASAAQTALPAAAAQTAAAPEPAPATASGPTLPMLTARAAGARPAAGQGLDSRQQEHLKELVERFTRKTRKSKELAQRYRSALADSRASVGFRFSVKEMLYPITCERARGSRVWDVDGNEYVDVTMSQGVSYFGHHPDFVIRAVEQELHRGIELNPRSRLAGEAAELISELTGMERVSFTNSGTEAVMTAIRLARTATGRNKIVFFNNSYHGHSDVTLVRPDRIDGRPAAAAMAAGVPPGVVADVIVLEYGAEASLEAIRGCAHELAAVVVEPIQSRRPDLQPREFLHQLRQLTEAAGALLVFDEMITGFRLHLGGAQAYFGVRADLATYGKFVAGGMPIGVIAGRREVMDGVDGGMWQFGDDSYPEAERTFVGGTFCQHPLAMAAAVAVLRHLKAEGPGLQERMNARTARLAADLNSWLEAGEVPIHIVHMSALFRLAFRGNFELLFYHMVDKGVYIWEWRNCFISTAHSDQDIAFIGDVIKASVEELRDGGYLPEAPAGVQRHRPAYPARPPAPVAVSRPAPEPATFPGNGDGGVAQVDFSLYYFGNYDAAYREDKYDLLFDGARFADRHGFRAIWVPERHFHSFGGLSPNPSLLGAALSRETRNVELRAGSVVLPLHHPIRVAEEWSMVDNFSRGRVGVSFAAGWNSDDFVLRPENFGEHREIMFRDIETVMKLWAGEGVRYRNGSGNEIEVKLCPMPRQARPKTWVTVVKNPDTYRRAGEIGAGVLTNLMSQSVEDLAANVELYRQALADHGRDPASGCVTVLLHAFLGEDEEKTVEYARAAFYDYLKASVSVLQNLIQGQGMEVDLEKMSPEDQDYVLSLAYDRYRATSALVGSPESCFPIVERLIGIGVDEIACLVDFGIDRAAVMDGLPHLDALRRRFVDTADGAAAASLPLTAAQRQLWVLSQLTSQGSASYNDTVILSLEGKLDRDALKRAAEQVVRRHEMLRARVDADGEKLWVLAPEEVEVALPTMPVAGVAAVREWLAQETRRPFDLTRAPILRLTLLEHAAEHHWLVITSHHMAADGWSLSIVIEELGALYSAHCEGRQAELAEPMQFRDYVEHQRRAVESPEMADHEAYWLALFGDSIPVLELPTDRPRPPFKTYNGDRRTSELGEELLPPLRKLSARHGCTLFMTLMSLYHLLLHRFCAQRDLVVGTPTGMRNFTGSESVVGYCTHLLTVRSQLSGTPSFADYLKEFRSLLLAAYEHQEYPFARLIDKLDVRHDPSRTPLVSTTFNLDIAIRLPQLSGLEVGWLPPPAGAIFDFGVNVTGIGKQMHLEWLYSRDLFDATTAVRIAGAYDALVRQVLAAPETGVYELDLLEAASRHQLLGEWGDAVATVSAPVALPAADERRIHLLVAAQAAEAPDRLAVGCADERLSYGELNERANRVGRYLLRQGVGPEVLVAVLTERSPLMVVAYLGILKAGAAYVPLDPIHPAERLRYIADDSAAWVVLSEEHLAGRLAGLEVPVACLDTGWQVFERFGKGDPEPLGTTENLAYMLYTSGSTGTPKAVEITHRSLANIVHWYRQTFGLDHQDRAAQTSGVGFDSIMEEIWPALITGGSTHIASQQVRTQPQALRDWMVEVGITVVALPTPMGEPLVDLEWPPDTALRHVILGGDRLKRRPGPTTPFQVVNQYGPTECTVICAAGAVAVQGETQRRPSIGRVVTGARIHLVDHLARPVPTGVSGELLIGGQGVGRGYHRRARLTAASYLPDPFSREPGERLYRTGDLVRWLADGRLEFIGRRDHQVKLRGLRIELGEIEVILSRHPDVSRSVVMVRDDLAAGSGLVAYVESRNGSTSDEALREHVRRWLPEYMVPAAFVVTEGLPMLPSGKVDRRSLPAPEVAHEEPVAPRTPAEEAVAEIWRQILQLEAVGVHDSFFRLGGHSMLATQIIARVNERLEVELAPDLFFEAPTIAGMAERVETLEWAAAAVTPDVTADEVALEEYEI